MHPVTTVLENIGWIIKLKSHTDNFCNGAATFRCAHQVKEISQGQCVCVTIILEGSSLVVVIVM
jgi:hypothetical protein